MKATPFLCSITLASIMIFAGWSQARADEPPTLDDVHHLLQQAAGDSPATAPSVAQQQDLVSQALKMFEQCRSLRPRVHRAVEGSLQDALNALSNGDADQARSKILEADDAVRSVTN